MLCDLSCIPHIDSGLPIVNEEKFLFIEVFWLINEEGMTELEYHHSVILNKLMSLVLSITGCYHKKIDNWHSVPPDEIIEHSLRNTLASKN